MKLTLKEKMLLTTGDGMWHTHAVGDLPRILLSDGPHGLRKNEDNKTNNDSVISTCFPTASAVACSWNRNVISMMASSIAKEAHNEDVSILLGPGINMKRSPLCGRNFEYFSEDPYLAGVLGTEFVKAVEELGVGTSLKHYCGNSQETNRMTSNSMIDDKALHEIYLKAFEMVVKNAHPATIMASYNLINGLYATENKYLLTDVLRNKWGFNGAVVSDWGACINLQNSLKAGMDLEMPDSHGFHIKQMKKAYKKKQITEEEITRASNNVEALVNKYKVDSKKEKYDVSNNHTNAIIAECESAVLLENDGILPLNTKDVLVIGGLANDVRYQGGGSSHINTDKVIGAVKALENEGFTVEYSEGYKTTTLESNEGLINDAVAKAMNGKLVLFFGGLTEVTEGEGYDRKTLAIPENQLVLLDEIYKVNKNIVFISFGGSPYDMSFSNKCRAILHMYLGGEGVMEAMAKLVMGSVNPSGKLAETIPYSISDTPSDGYFALQSKDIKYKESIFIGYRYYDTFDVDVRYPFGYGMSYTKFEYSDINVSKNGDNVDVSFKIKNIGSVSGKEIAQVYVASKNGKYLHPKKELKGFDKIELKPNEEKNVIISLDQDAFKAYDTELGFVTPSGEYEILICASSRDVRLTGSVSIEGIEYSKEFPKYLADLDRKLHNVTDEEFKELYNKEFSHLDDIRKGSFTMANSLRELAPYSFKARMLLKIARHEIKKMYNKPFDDPEVMMVIETLETGTLDLVSCQSGIPYRLMESIVLSGNGHRFKALHKLIWG